MHERGIYQITNDTQVSYLTWLLLYHSTLTPVSNRSYQVYPIYVRVLYSHVHHQKEEESHGFFFLIQYDRIFNGKGKLEKHAYLGREGSAGIGLAARIRDSSTPVHKVPQRERCPCLSWKKKHNSTYYTISHDYLAVTGTRTRRELFARPTSLLHSPARTPMSPGVSTSTSRFYHLSVHSIFIYQTILFAIRPSAASIARKQLQKEEESPSETNQGNCCASLVHVVTYFRVGMGPTPPIALTPTLSCYYAHVHPLIF